MVLARASHAWQGLSADRFFSRAMPAWKKRDLLRVEGFGLRVEGFGLRV